jgi:flavin reductase (DIM6/NTAB) family NADH-FMN oxidoreductase RutF
MTIDFSTLSEADRYALMSNSIFPRPIAWITTQDEGIINLAPFSYFIPLSSEPPLVIVSIAHKEDGSLKDTFSNIIKHKTCTINLAHKELLDALINSAQDLPKEVSECDKFDISTKILLKEYPPMVANAKCALFCEFVKTMDIGSKYEPILLKVKYFYIDDQSIDDIGHIHLDNIGRVGMEFLVGAKRVQNQEA